MTISWGNLPPAVRAQLAEKHGVMPPKRGRRKPGEPTQESELELHIAHHLRVLGIPYEREVRVIPSRDWRFDFTFPPHKLALEVDGGTYVAGRHTRGAGFASDIAKLNTASVEGWVVLHADTTMVRDGSAVAMVERMLVRLRRLATPP
jgi:very-short-patch-repair endonuclease